MNDSWRTDEQGVGMPEGLAGLLRGLGDGAGLGGGVTGSVDLAVLGGARRVGRRRRVTRRAVRGGAVAAVIGIVGGGVWLSGGGAVQPGGVVAIAEDLDGDGLVDMRDALILARAVADGQGRDVDGDGVIDRGDVERVATMAVSLGGDGGGMQTLGVVR